MSINHDITVHDFKNICRTCLSREDLKPLYDKCSLSTCLAEMFICCTFVKFTEDDGLPAKICTNCIYEINQAFSFAKRCEATDTILRKCIKINTELANNLSQSVEPVIKVEEGIQTEIKSEIIVPNVQKPVENVLGDYEFVEIKQEENEEIENEYDATYDDPTDESYQEDDDVDETSSEASDNPASTSFQIQGGSLKNEENKAKHLKINKPTQTVEKPNVGLVCNVPIQLDQLKDKMKMHTDERPYTCGVCSKAFARSYNLKYHMRLHTGEKPYTCEVCKKSFSRPDNFRSHMIMHTGEKPYTCEICNKAFARHGHLKKHVRLHSGEKPYICDICNKAFAQQDQLKKHASVHTGERPYACEVCNKFFTRPDHRKIHMNIHTGEKPYTCDVCNKAFTQSHHLKLHMNIHTGKKPYNCEICNKVFTQHTNLKRHIRTHNKEKPYSCDVCCKNYTSDKYLVVHKLKFHNISEVTVNKI